MQNLSLVLGISLIILSGSVSADFKFSGATTPAQVSKTSFLTDAIDTSAFGKNMPLHSSLELIAGPHVILDLGADVNRDALVSWRGGRSRRKVLDELFSSTSGSWWFKSDKSTLIVRTAREVSIAKKLGLLDKQGFPTIPVIWAIEAPTTVRTLFADWMTKVAGGNFEWMLQDDEDCSVSVSYKIEGTIDDAVRTVVNASRRNPECTIPSAIMSRNNVLVVGG